MNKSYIVSGCQFGDEGKGTITDYLASIHNLKENVRYNGGSHASHTVIIDGVKHKFSQLGSSFLTNDIRTYLSENTIVNPFNLVTEAKVLSSKIGIPTEEILKRIFISEQASVVTPYHSLINKVRELSDKNKRTGSVGTGVSEVYKIKEKTGLDLKVSDLLDGKSKDKLIELYHYTREYVLKNRDKINPQMIKKYLDIAELEMLIDPKNEQYLVTCYHNLLDSVLLNTCPGIKEFHQDEDILFEGSQAVLIDRKYGIRPNTTSLSTTNHYGVKLAEELGTEIKRIGCISSLTSRHGMGLLPTYDEYLQERIFDENQMPSFYQGCPRYGWFDTLLLRYSLRVSPNDELFMSALDRLSNLGKIKICDKYLYTGEIDDDFKKTFEYFQEGKKTIITDIKENTDCLRKYLARCLPIYIELNGFDEDISKIKDYDSLPDECINFVDTVEVLTGTRITLVGVGPKRKQKLKRRC